MPENIDEEYVHLSCQKYTCLEVTNSETIAVKIKDYKYGDYKCDICGGLLNTFQENTIKHQLWALGFKPE